MDSVELYLSILSTIIGLSISTLTFLFKMVKSTKGKKIFEGLLNLTNDIIPFIVEAEKFINYNGVEKKEYVMTKTRKLILEKKYKVSEEFISDKIEELIEFTKTVNSNDKTKKIIEIMKGSKDEF